MATARICWRCVTETEVRYGLLSAHLSGLCQGEVLRDYADLGADDILILSEAFEHEDSTADVNADAVALPVCCVDLLALETEVAALVDVAEDAEAELDRMENCGVEGAESILGLLEGDGACHFVSDALLVGGGVEVWFGLKGEAETTVDFAVGCEDKGGGE